MSRNDRIEDAIALGQAWINQEDTTRTFEGTELSESEVLIRMENAEHLFASITRCLDDEEVLEVAREIIQGLQDA